MHQGATGEKQVMQPSWQKTASDCEKCRLPLPDPEQWLTGAIGMGWKRWVWAWHELRKSRPRKRTHGDISEDAEGSWEKKPKTILTIGAFSRQRCTKPISASSVQSGTSTEPEFTDGSSSQRRGRMCTSTHTCVVHHGTVPVPASHPAALLSKERRCV